MLAKWQISTLAFLFISASPPKEADTPIRLGIRLLDMGESERALRAFESVAETAGDPGLVAFDRGVTLTRLDRHREAELQFLQCLDDAEIPTERRAKALYNRGVCLLQRGEDLVAIRAAIDCFAACRDAASDSMLRADAGHNLEIAKVRWLNLRAKQTNPPTPNDGSPESAKSPAGEAETNGESGSSGLSATAKATTGVVPGDRNAARPSPQVTPGTGTLPVLIDTAKPMPLSAEDTQSYLDLTAQRLARQRQNVESQRGGPERPGVRDW